MEKEHSLRKTRDFLAVQQHGKTWVDRLLVLKARPNGQLISRCGFSVGKGVGKAVVRNKVKRRLREAVPVTQILSGWDLVFIARKGSASVDFQTLKGSVDSLLERSKLMANGLSDKGVGKCGR